MRILVASGASGGTSKGSVGKYYHLKEFSEYLEKFNVECKLVRETDYVIRFPTKQIYKLVSNKNKLKQLIDDFKPDLVFTDGKTAFGLEIIKLGIPLFVLLRGDWWSLVEYAKDTIYDNFFMRKVVDMRNDIANEMMSKATVLLPICNYLVGITKQHHPEQVMKVFIEGIESSKWYKTEGMQLKHPCVGLLQDANHWAKTKEMLVLETVIEKMPDVNFYWAGDGKFKNRILPRLDKFKNFHWLGPLQYPDKVKDFLTEIDVYALLTGGDTTPLSLKEAQLMEIPVLATDFGGIPEIMSDGTTGYLVKKGDSIDLIKKISALLNDKKLSKEMGESGRKFIQKEFSLEASAKNFLDIIKPYMKKQ